VLTELKAVMKTWNQLFTFSIVKRRRRCVENAPSPEGIRPLLGSGGPKLGDAGDELQHMAGDPPADLHGLPLVLQVVVADGRDDRKVDGHEGDGDRRERGL